MYTVRVRSDFSSAHNLKGYKGKCEDLHGHNWQVEVVASSGKLDATGMVIDFKELKGLLKESIAELDHKHLNELECFRDMNPTSENIARHVYEDISRRRPGLKLKEVTVWETGSSSATYTQG